MNEHSQTSARLVALDVLCKLNLQNQDVSEILHRYLSKTNEKSLVTDIVYGTIRNLNLLDYLLSKIGNVSPDRVDKRSMNILRMGAYQTLFNQSVPEYAIVNEMVSLVKSKKPRGFINAVLRNLLRSIENRNIECEIFDSANTLPISNKTAVIFKEALLPNPQQNFSEYLSVCFSLPEWLIEDWTSEFGEEKTIEICFGSNRRPSVYLRPNILKTTQTKLADKLSEYADGEVSQKGITIEKLDNSAIKISHSLPIQKMNEFKNGLFTVQDITAQKVAFAISPKPGDVVADICSAPGTKTSHLVELMNNQGKVIATDVDSKRLEKVNENSRRLGIEIIDIIDYASAYESIANSNADIILLDVPCSNTGVLSKRCELRHRINETAINDLAKVQLRILEKTTSLIPTSKKICYSTCSIAAKENSQLVRKFIKSNPEFIIEKEELTLPSATAPDHDGGYFAILIRTNTSKPQ